MQVFRAWTQDTDELIAERPQNLQRLLLTKHFPGCRASPVTAATGMLSAAPVSATCIQGGKWGPELEELFNTSTTVGNAQGEPIAGIAHNAFGLRQPIIDLCKALAPVNATDSQGGNRGPVLEESLSASTTIANALGNPFSAGCCP